MYEWYWQWVQIKDGKKIPVGKPFPIAALATTTTITFPKQL